MKQDRRGSWYLLTGVVLGIAFGLVYSWVVSPVKYIDAPPYSLREDYKEQYRVLVALAYLSSGDLLRAQDRLNQLKDSDIVQTIASQAQRALADGHPDEEVKALSQLAAALNSGLPPASISSPVSQDVTLPPPSEEAPADIDINPAIETFTSTIETGDTPTSTLLTPVP